MPVMSQRFAVCGDRRAPRTVKIAGFEMHLWSQPVARGRNLAFEGNFSIGNDRDFLAQAFGMSDDMSRKNDRDAFVGLGPDQPFQLALIERVETGKWFVKDDQIGVVHQCAEQLYRLRHALGQLPDLLVGGIA